jgi:hypothetical protein
MAGLDSIDHAVGWGKALKWADIILGSHAAALPGGAVTTPTAPTPLRAPSADHTAARRYLLAFALAMVFSLYTAGMAGAAAVSFTPSFSNNLLGEGGGFTAPFTFSGTEYYGGVDPITEVTVHLPAGIGGDSSGFGICTVATLEMMTPTGCPPGSLAGPVTPGGLEDDIIDKTPGSTQPPTLVTEAVTSQAVYTDRGLVFYVEGVTPVALWYILSAREVPDSGLYGRVLTVSIPTLPSIPEQPNISFTSLDLAVGAEAQDGGSAVHNVIIPSQCASSFAWAGDVKFEDGSTSHLTATTTCPGSRPPAPPPPPPPPPPATGGLYVAMGDSYSSGEGTASYDRGTDTSTDKCHRSSENSSKASYPRLLQLDSSAVPSNMKFVACSGATINDVLHGRYGEPSQMSALGPNVTLVTISIGGDNLGFSHVLEECVNVGPFHFRSDDTCVGQENELREKLWGPDPLNAKLINLYRAIKQQAPHARIVVMGYPRLFPQGSDNSCGLPGLRYMDSLDLAWLNSWAEVLDVYLEESGRQERRGGIRQHPQRDDRRRGRRPLGLRRQQPLDQRAAVVSPKPVRILGRELPPQPLRLRSVGWRSPPHDRRYAERKQLHHRSRADRRTDCYRSAGRSIVDSGRELARQHSSDHSHQPEGESYHSAERRPDTRRSASGRGDV